MPNHFYIAPDIADLNPGNTITLSSDQLHYLKRVLRLRSGDGVNCFDGEGLRFHAHLGADQKLTVASCAAREPPPVIRIHLALALLKGAAMDHAIQLGCESGADDISLFAAHRSNVQFDARRLGNKVVHWQRVIVSACEQSGRSYLPIFNAEGTPSTILQNSPDAITYALHMDGGPFNSLTGADRLLFIGPEGGWSDEELRFFEEEKVQRVSVGPTTLRAESTPGAAMAILNYLDSTL
ncbi:MAG: RsmE family RNA methyltransferase [Pseudomonadota bacterium]|jgi:16S rRNA (uracil1498-N3)-methyltransferase|nr:RsmE family RNA methyltransferase [Pseudomonadota bacterium]